MDDLWRFDLTVEEGSGGWTRIEGGQCVSSESTYYSKSFVSIWPAARSGACQVYSSSSELWYIFGGVHQHAPTSSPLVNGTYMFLNDV